MPGQAADSLRSEMQKPLLAAQELIKAQKYEEALSKLKEAEAIPEPNDYESFLLAQLRGVAAGGAGDYAIAAKSFEAVLKSGRIAPAERPKFIQQTAIFYYKAKDYPASAKWFDAYYKEGGTDQELHTIHGQALFLAGDYAACIATMQSVIAASEAAGQPPVENQLNVLANAYLKQKDFVGYASTLEKLVVHYPTKERWADLINQISSKPTFSSNLSLDAGRLRLVTGNVRGPGDYINLAQAALDYFPAEARKIVEEGFTQNVLGTGPDAKNHLALRDKTNKATVADQKALASDEKKAAKTKDGNILVTIGFNYVTHGATDKGIALMEQGIQLGGVKAPDHAKLHLGIAYLQAGQKDKAIAAFESVKGNDGSADLARLWTYHIRQTQK
ncbi:hypothetical protein B9N43_07520 [Denitratisoma sp. DHT3]|nr:hypothetical protein B9N43_07520 [Denitratisoma sp. DHT3]